MADDAIKTVAGEITKIAVEHGYNGVAPKTITGAIDALADTLAGSDVDSGQTIAQAVRALAPYIGSGGGGTLGSMQHGPGYSDTAPVVGEGYHPANMTAYDISVGGQKVVDSDAYGTNSIYLVASGASCTFSKELDERVSLDDISVSAYVVTAELVNHDYVCTGVTPWDGEFVLSISEDEYPYLLISYTVPELDVSNGEGLCFLIGLPQSDEDNGGEA